MVAAVTTQALNRLWARTSTEFDAAWAGIRSRVFTVLQLGRAATVHAAIPYTGEVLAETKQVGVPSGALIPKAFLDTAPNGFPVMDTLDSLPVRAKQAVARGLPPLEAQRAAGKWLTGVSLTMLADTRRDVYQADIIQRPQVTGYVRMLNPPSCDLCVILAGKRFLWNQGFQRHKNCDCTHIPASEALAGDLTTDPYAYFRSLTEAEQNATFGKVQADAVRDGADIYRVTNTRARGLGTAAGNARYGTPVRSLESIYRHDKSRRFVVENLRYHGYITGPQTPGGNILGNDPVGRVLAAGRGSGRVATARAARFDAVVTGRRDPLNRATMTAAEKRLYDAHYRAMWADAGYRPNTVGANSADRGLGLRPVTPAESARAQDELQKQLARTYATDSNGRFVEPDQVRDLARLLGL